MNAIVSKNIKSPIDWVSEAKPMIEKYLCHPKKILTTTSVPLEYIRIKKEDVEGLLSNDSIKEIVVFLAVSYDDLNEPNPDQQDFTFLIAGAECETDNLVINTDSGMVFNQFEPCPDKCLKYKDPSHRPSRAVDGADCNCTP